MGTLRVGLTGGLASGKTLVAERLRAAGYLVVDADRLVAELYASGSPGSAIVAQLFGSGLLGPDGAVDKTALARLIFSDPEARGRLEKAIHPLVRDEFTRRTAASDVAVLEATRLIEAGFAPDFDLIVTVEAPRELRLERATARGMSPEDARRRLDAQGDGQERRRAAGWRIDNDGSLGALEAEIGRLLADLDRRVAEARATIASGGEGNRANGRARNRLER